MDASNAAPVSEMARPDLVLTRVFTAPRALVFQAWTDPAHVRQWWGPNGFSVPRCDWVAQAGGAIHLDMRGPDGVTFPMIGHFETIEPPSLLVFRSSALNPRGEALFDVENTVTFMELEGQTILTVSVRVVHATAAAAPHLQGAPIGWAQTLERLRGHLGEIPDEPRANRAIVAERVLAAPRDRVWRMWTDPSEVACWWGPDGFTTTVESMDVRVGGLWRLTMHGPDGRDYPNLTVYTEVTAPSRLVYHHVSHPPFEHVVTFTDEGPATRVRVEMVFPSKALRDRVVGEVPAERGLDQTLDKLARHLSGR
jgi:uncharacterized protein YndB with AHSA1/START domain